ncbi:hypothetical protein ALC57_05909 [Trachymyrmex cornetzi]|uniref:Uncharacterized protein n=1 Tax=Trachymyrmex cornetzi TaxID=471704 RepID=A0A151J9L0_9HYME|nr:hypothetical protein ALC57_05909 [Trachymyrmex cornetzi]
MRCLILPRLRPCSQNSSLSPTTAVMQLLIWGMGWQNWSRRLAPCGEKRKTAQGTAKVQAATAFHLNQREYE